MSLTSTHNSFFPSITHAHKRSAVLTIILLFFTIQIGAQEFTSTSVYRAQPIDMSATPAAQVDGYHQYQSTIYEPFSGLTPSSSNGGNNQPSGISGRRNTTIDPGNGDDWGSNSDGGDQENSYPIGEPWIMLAFAAAAAGVVYIKRRSATKKSRSC